VRKQPRMVGDGVPEPQAAQEQRQHRAPLRPSP
jgi:hypothetical protein